MDLNSAGLIWDFKENCTVFHEKISFLWQNKIRPWERKTKSLWLKFTWNLSGCYSKFCLHSSQNKLQICILQVQTFILIYNMSLVSSRNCFKPLKFLQEFQMRSVIFGRDRWLTGSANLDFKFYYLKIHTINTICIIVGLKSMASMATVHIVQQIPWKIALHYHECFLKCE